MKTTLHQKIISKLPRSHSVHSFIPNTPLAPPSRPDVKGKKAVGIFDKVNKHPLIFRSSLRTSMKLISMKWLIIDVDYKLIFCGQYMNYILIINLKISIVILEYFTHFTFGEVSSPPSMTSSQVLNETGFSSALQRLSSTTVERPLDDAI